MLKKTTKIGDTVHKIMQSYPYCVQTGKVVALHKTFLKHNAVILTFVDIKWPGNKNPETFVKPDTLFTDPIEAIDDFISKSKTQLGKLKEESDNINHIVDVLREERTKLKGNL
jgi:hypothetical protein